MSSRCITTISTCSGNNNTSVYLDYNATTPLAPEVLTSIQDALQYAWGNPSSPHQPGINAKKIITEARGNVAAMIGANPSDVIFTSGGTEGNNWIISSAVRYFEAEVVANTWLHGSERKQRPHFVSSNLEHDSVRLVLEHLQSEGIAEVTYVPASKKSGQVELDDVLSAIRPNTIMVTIMLANNETGVIQPISSIFSGIKMRKRQPGETRRILLHTDAAQAIGKIQVDVSDLNTDFLTIVGHKFYGPRIGAVYVRDLDKAPPLFPMLYGGGQEKNFRPGTENTGMIAGLGKAAELVRKYLESYQNYMLEVRNYLEESLQREFGSSVHINGRFQSSSRLPNTCNFSIIGQGLEGHKILAEAQCIQASVGAACHAQNRASPILLAIGIPVEIASNALRFSVGRDTRTTDIDFAIQDLKRCVEVLGGCENLPNS